MGAKIWKWWSVFLLLILTPAAYVFNPDIVVTPYLRSCGYGNFFIFLVSGSSGTLEMIVWFVGWGGLVGLIAGWFKEDINFAKKIAGEIKKDGHIDSIKIYFTKKYEKYNERACKLAKGFKIGSYFGFFWVGFWPIPGPRVLGDFVCGTTKNKKLLFALCAGNLVKTACLIYAWNKLFSFFGH